MTTPAFIPVILAGGSGERFWPLSRKHRPKQFLTLDETGRSLLQATSDRLGRLSGGADQVMVVTGTEYRTQVLEQLPEIPTEHLIVEPVARDTAPAVLYAALPVAQEDPATGYGYVQRGELLVEGDLPAFQMSRFTEKPDAETAQALIDDGRYTWNSGMFIWQVQAILAAFEQHQPAMYAQLSAAVQQGRSPCGIRDVFPELRKISIDSAILEKSDRVAVIPAEFGIATTGLEDVVVVRTDEVTLVVRKDRTQDIKKVVQQLKSHPELERVA